MKTTTPVLALLAFALASAAPGKTLPLERHDLVVKEFTLLDIPFSFTKAEQVDALTTGPFGQALFAKLPDRNDFMTLDADERRRRWRIAVAQSQRLADEFATLAERDSISALPL